MADAVAGLRDLWKSIKVRGGTKIANGDALSLHDSFMAWSSAITWGEPNIRLLLAAYGGVLLLILLTRRIVEVQAVILVALGATVLCAERLNTYAGANWRAQGWTQNYFDKSGIFMLTMLTGPCLALTFLQVGLLVRESGNLVVQVKRAQLLRQRAAGAAPTADLELPKKTE
jgi:hypothetical protein